MTYGTFLGWCPWLNYVMLVKITNFIVVHWDTLQTVHATVMLLPGDGPELPLAFLRYTNDHRVDRVQRRNRT